MLPQTLKFMRIPLRLAFGAMPSVSMPRTKLRFCCLHGKDLGVEAPRPSGSHVESARVRPVVSPCGSLLMGACGRRCSHAGRARRARPDRRSGAQGRCEGTARRNGYVDIENDLERCELLGFDIRSDQAFAKYRAWNGNYSERDKFMSSTASTAAAISTWIGREGADYTNCERRSVGSRTASGAFGVVSCGVEELGPIALARACRGVGSY